jgi:hypothetical protein
VNADDDGFLLAGWLIKTAATLAVLGFVGYDGFSVVTTNLSVADRAGTYASTAADAYLAGAKDPEIVQKAYDAVAAAAQQHGDTVPPASFRITTDGAVTLVVTHTAPTLWMKSIGPLVRYTHVSASGTGAGPS